MHQERVANDGLELWTPHADVEADQANLLLSRCSWTRQPAANPGYMKELSAPYAAVHRHNGA
jgi:hypothetical protein